MAADGRRDAGSGQASLRAVDAGRALLEAGAMSDQPPAPPPRKLRIFGREEAKTRHSDAFVPTDAADGHSEASATNPYWLAEEPSPHPHPELGCIRRGICCRSNPGWFAPGEVEKAAALQGMEPDAFVRKYLIIDALDLDGQKVHVFAPVKLDRFGKPALPTGRPVDALYRALRGVCVFFDGQGCKIYGARPYECGKYVCTNAPEDNASHEEIAALWAEGTATPEAPSAGREA
jgi:Fe-S-cluster containining protein